MSSPTPLRSTSGSYSLHRRRGRPGLRGPRVRLSKMKLMYFLMDRDEQHKKRLELELEVSELETVLEKEKRLSRILQCSLQGRVVCHCCLSTLVPTKVRGLLAELAIVEDEIFYLDKKVEDLRLRLHRERKWTDQCILQQQQQQQQQQNWPQNRQQRHSICGLGCRRELQGGEQFPKLPCPGSDEALECESKASVGSVSAKGEGVEQIRRSSHSFDSLILPERKICLASPNKLSEELIRLMVIIFHKLNKTTDAIELELSGTSKLNISCIGSRSLVPKASVNGNAVMNSLKNRRLSKGDDGAAKEIGCSKRIIEFTRSSFDVGRISLCLVDIKYLRVLIHKLCTVDPSFLTNKQKLAFWINIYNFCIMHAFLQHGLPPSPDKLLALLNQASVNVGGTVLNVLSIEHLILRHSPEGNQGIMDEGERDLQLSYGLGYPEPNVVFALCRGSRSSPALSVYTAEDVSNELERAKIEYLESSVRVVSKKRIVLPKLLHWHMGDFADDVESLLEWIYSQLPRSGPLKRTIRELLSADSKTAPAKIVEIEPYNAEFHYLLPLW